MLIMEIEPSLPTLSELPELGQVDLKVRFSLGATKKVVMFGGSVPAARDAIRG
jgi:hypothetical protein